MSGEARVCLPLQNQAEGKIFRIWLKKDLKNRRICYGKNFQDLLNGIISKFKLPVDHEYELRNGYDGTIIDTDLDFNWQSENSILVLFNKSNGELWSDQIVSKIRHISPGAAANEHQKQMVNINIQHPKNVAVGNNNSIFESITACPRCDRNKMLCSDVNKHSGDSNEQYSFEITSSLIRPSDKSTVEHSYQVSEH